MDDPLRGSVSAHGSILGFGSLEKVKNHCSKCNHSATSQPLYSNTPRRSGIYIAVTHYLWCGI